MTVLDGAFLFFSLISILGGIATGVHFAFRSFEQRNIQLQKTSAKIRKAPNSAKSEHLYQRKESKNEDHFQKRVQKHQSQSYSEFECNLDGKNHKKKLDQIMREQNDSYHYLIQRKENDGENHCHEHVTMEQEQPDSSLNCHTDEKKHIEKMNQSIQGQDHSCCHLTQRKPS